MRHFLESSELWSRLEPALDRALDMSAEDRSAWLASIAATDAELHRALVEILRRDPAFFDSGVAGSATPLGGDELPLAPGTMVGPYRVIRAIGQGGMGIVYHAERADGQFEMPVALKVVRGAAPARADLERRFLEERGILARLAHPGIARLLDGGVSAEGRPFFAMELIDGLPLTAYAGRRRLPIADRLALFLKVCDAVQYAHGNLVIHRDLKPSNVLVTSAGEVKLLDFGVAKVLADRAEGDRAGTAPATMLVTPSYASPEQLRGEPVSTASDVYSLGVVLYELVTGRRPVDLGSVPPHRWTDELAREAVPAPSSVPGVERVAAAADLDAVIATAIRFSPDARYPTVEAFAADVRRFLAGLPVEARPATLRYRAARFWYRHRVALSLVGVAAALVTGFAIVTVIQSKRIARQAAIAIAERDRLDRVNQFLLGVFATFSPYTRAGGIPSPAVLLDSSVARLEREFADEPAIRGRLLEEIGHAYFGVGDYAGAIRSIRRAIEIARATGDPSELGFLLMFLGQLLGYPGGASDGEAELRESLAIRERLAGDTGFALARIRNALSVHLARRGHTDEAERLAALGLGYDSVRIPTDTTLLAQSWRNLGHAARYAGRFDTALVRYRRAHVLLAGKFGNDNPEVGNALINIGVALEGLGRLAEAAEAIAAGLEIRYRTLGLDNEDLATDQVHQARVLTGLGRLAEAESLATVALTRLRQGPAASLNLAAALRVHGGILLARGDRRAGCPLLLEQARIMSAGTLGAAVRDPAIAAAAPCQGGPAP